MTHTLRFVMLPVLAVAASCGGHHVRLPTSLPPNQDLSPHQPAPGTQSLATNLAPAATPPSTPPQRRETATTTEAERDRQVQDSLTSINTLLDAYFDFNAYRLRPDAIEAVSQAAATLKQHVDADPGIRLIVEGHCDERGSAEFNLALGDRRAESVRDLLSQLGIAEGRMTTISYGENRPECSEANETCWQRNRRAHIRHER